MNNNNPNNDNPSPQNEHNNDPTVAPRVTGIIFEAHTGGGSQYILNKPYIEIRKIMSYEDRERVNQGIEDTLFFESGTQRKVDLFVDTNNNNQWEWFYVIHDETTHQNLQGLRMFTDDKPY